MYKDRYFATVRYFWFKFVDFNHRSIYIWAIELNLTQIYEKIIV